MKRPYRHWVQRHYSAGTGSVYLNGDNSLTFKAGLLDPTAVAFGNFTDQSIHPSAFGDLEIKTNNEYSDLTQARCVLC